MAHTQLNPSRGERVSGKKTVVSSCAKRRTSAVARPLHRVLRFAQEHTDCAASHSDSLEVIAKSQPAAGRPIVRQTMLLCSLPVRAADRRCQGRFRLRKGHRGRSSEPKLHRKSERYGNVPIRNTNLYVRNAFTVPLPYSHPETATSALRAKPQSPPHTGRTTAIPPGIRRRVGSECFPSDRCAHRPPSHPVAAPIRGRSG